MTSTRRCPQLNDDTAVELRLPPQTEEWADALLLDSDEREGFEVERTDEALIVRTVVVGNCNGLTVARGFLQDCEDLLREGDVDPMEFTLIVTSQARGARSHKEPDVQADTSAR